MKEIQMKDFLSPSGTEVNIIPVLQGDGYMKIDEAELPDSLPILALRNAVLFPGTIYPITIGREKSIKLIEDAEKNNAFIGAVPQNDISVEDPKKEDLYQYGTVAKILKTLEMPDGTVTAILQGFKRFEIESVTEYEPYMLGLVKYLHDTLPDGNDKNIKMIAEALKEKAITILKMSAYMPREAASALKSIDGFEFLVNFIATTIEVENFDDKVQLLQYAELKTRAMKLLSVLDTQIELLKIKQDINQKVKMEIDQQQREYYLNSQLRTIQEELGMDEMEDYEKLRARAAEKKWPESVAEIFEKEMTKLERYNPSSPDYSIQFNYIQFMLDLPWGEMSKDNLDLKHAQKVLDEDHFGLDTVKERIIEYLAVLKLKGDMKSPILCLYGPPGVGKTSLGKSIARALGRKYVRIALGGVHDESEIRGHRKTYIGALPGRILNAINRAGTSTRQLLRYRLRPFERTFPDHGQYHFHHSAGTARQDGDDKRHRLPGRGKDEHSQGLSDPETARRAWNREKGTQDRQRLPRENHQRLYERVGCPRIGEADSQDSKGDREKDSARGKLS